MSSCYLAATKIMAYLYVNDHDSGWDDAMCRIFDTTHEVRPTLSERWSLPN